MKKRTIFFIALASMLMIGCSQKAPEVEPVVMKKRTPVKIDETVQTTTSTITTDTIPPDAIDGGSLDDDVGRLQSVEVDSSDMTSNRSSGIEPIYFGFDQYIITDQELDKVANNARIIKARGSRVRVEGNCDEWGTDEYNMALGLKRAKSGKEALIANGVSPSMITILSNGESKPVCTEHNEVCWQKNRRDDFILLGN